MAGSARLRAWGGFAAAWFGSFAGAVLIDRPIGEISRAVVPAAAWFALAVLLSGVMLVGSRRSVAVGMWLAVAALFAGMTTARLARTPGGDAAAFLAAARPGDAPVLVEAEGRVTQTRAARRIDPASPEAHLFAKPRPGFELRVDRWLLEDGTALVGSGTVGVVGPEADALVRVGDRVRVRGMLRAVMPPMNPGAFDARPDAAQSGRIGTLVFRDAGAIGSASSVGGLDALRGWWLRTRAGWRERAMGLFDRVEYPRSGALLAALTLGARDAETRTLRESFIEAGIAHLLAVSGFHVAVLFMATVGLVRLTGDRPRVERLVAVAMLVAIPVMIPVEPPIARALAMVSAVLLPGIIGRRYDRLAVLAWVSIGLLVWRPLDAGRLGFQLTVGITALLLWLSSERHRWVSASGERRWAEADAAPWFVQIWSSVRRGFVACVLCWLVAAPAILWHTGSIVLTAAPAASIATPAIALTLLTGYATLIASLVSGTLAAGLAMVAHGSAEVSLAIVDAMERVPLASFALPPVSAAWAVFATLSVVVLIRTAEVRAVRGWVGVAFAVAWLGVEAVLGGRLGPGVSARVDTLSVGDGSCLVVRSGNGAVLWDCGSLSPGVGDRVIAPALRSLGAVRVPTAIITHNNVDHYGALVDVGRAVGLERVLVSEPALEAMRAARAGSAPRAFLDGMDRMGATVEPISAGSAIRVGTAELRVIWPPSTMPRGISAANDLSVVAVLATPTEAGERRVLLCGDIQRGAIAHLLDGPAAKLLDVDAMELPHHGSYHALARAFVDAASPAVVLQSTGDGRLAERRWDATRATIHASGGGWYITARDGAAWVEVLTDGRLDHGSMRPPSSRRTRSSIRR